jgi:hypothetical protein
MRNADELDELDEQWRELTPQADLWVLVCGGIAAVAAFAAAFFASGGVGHAATPPAPAHNITVQACPAMVAGR